MVKPTPLQRAIKAAKGEAALGAALGVDRRVVHNWHERGIPVSYCPLIEQATGVRCEELAPHVMWHVLRTSPPALPAARTLTPG